LKAQLSKAERLANDLEGQLKVKDNAIKAMRDRVAEAQAAAEQA